MMGAAVCHRNKEPQGKLVADCCYKRHRKMIMNHERWHQLGIWLRLLPPQSSQSSGVDFHHANISY